MRIRVRRSGGFAGLERLAEVDTAGLADAHEWHALARRVVASGAGAPPVGVPDGFGYRITVDGATVYAADPDLTEEERTLIARVLGEGC
ncbi:MULTISPECIES: protealysin inhibitor emfourin [unclassified Streptomyces]|uniref:protealysin inhibitor emfourin n=1 Tax=unclassified Streptomyces TaxID=2593676 RepID=UPI00190628C9|nr:protealysin inhibitor emfourin [Streptomyces sp. HSG2]